MKKVEIHQTLEDLLDERMEALDHSSGREACREQLHLEEGTSERTYWHYGYASALKDVLGILQGTGKMFN
jgi:Mn-dependent DtxR family transcriptional regulator